MGAALQSLRWHEIRTTLVVEHTLWPPPSGHKVMNSDMKRLCRAAEDAAIREDVAIFDPSKSEAIVRAVLTELKKPSDTMLAAGDPEYHFPSAEGVTEQFSDMIDCVLAVE
jgi:hypothetical protein